MTDKINIEEYEPQGLQPAEIEPEVQEIVHKQSIKEIVKDKRTNSGDDTNNNKRRSSEESNSQNYKRRRSRSPKQKINETRGQLAKKICRLEGELKEIRADNRTNDRAFKDENTKYKKYRAWAENKMERLQTGQTQLKQKLDETEERLRTALRENTKLEKRNNEKAIEALHNNVKQLENDLKLADEKYKLTKKTDKDREIISLYATINQLNETVEKLGKEKSETNDRKAQTDNEGIKVTEYIARTDAVFEKMKTCKETDTRNEWAAHTIFASPFQNEHINEKESIISEKMGLAKEYVKYQPAKKQPTDFMETFVIQVIYKRLIRKLNVEIERFEQMKDYYKTQWLETHPLRNTNEHPWGMVMTFLQPNRESQAIENLIDL